ncbi:hypothetical protein NVP1082O_57 [Vibrio phage 1.082.O._10N.261.49.E4]|nr:hypothetical protein NVP1082O_57 [Vibrio phage 1.082.O._10N.261.49.E4]AUR89867.1 hypothetical protein NVP1133O_66 [Vibrio phage 1.133.O._10N.222.51.E4]AUR99508.1 hypothetical protein NVP1266O_59 [Vibrio phage 1.266.O._10N.286.52.F9]
MATAILILVDKRTRKYSIDELPEKQIRSMNRVERIHDFMLDGKDTYLSDAKTLIGDGFPVYRIID